MTTKSKLLKAERARQRMLDKAKEFSTGTYVARFVAPVFQRMIRAEAAALPAGFAPAIIKGQLTEVFRHVGQCVCVTCGVVKAWNSGLGGMHTGHFLASRRNSILFDESNVAPQCSRCNRYESGKPQHFRLWMEDIRGSEEIERLEHLRNTIRKFTLDELVDMRIKYQTRFKAAEARVVQGD